MALTISRRTPFGLGLVRVDRAIETSVTPQILDWNPTAGIQEVARVMTQPRLAPATLAGTVLLGPSIGLFQRLRLKFAAARSRKTVEKMLAARGLQGYAQPDAIYQGYGTGAAEDQQAARALRLTRGAANRPQATFTMRAGAARFYPQGGAVADQLARQAVRGMNPGVSKYALAQTMFDWRDPTRWER
jgi:hypothetical protein